MGKLNASCETPIINKLWACLETVAAVFSYTIFYQLRPLAGHVFGKESTPGKAWYCYSNSISIIMLMSYSALALRALREKHDVFDSNKPELQAYQSWRQKIEEARITGIYFFGVAIFSLFFLSSQDKTLPLNDNYRLLGLILSGLFLLRQAEKILENFAIIEIKKNRFDADQSSTKPVIPISRRIASGILFSAVLGLVSLYAFLQLRHSLAQWAEDIISNDYQPIPDILIIITAARYSYQYSKSLFAVNTQSKILAAGLTRINAGLLALCLISINFFVKVFESNSDSRLGIGVRKNFERGIEDLIFAGCMLMSSFVVNHGCIQVKNWWNTPTL